MSSPAPATLHRRAAPPRQLALLVEWQPWWPAFLGNLSGLFARTPALIPSSAPAAFWDDVFVSRPIPWKQIGISAAVHALAISAVLSFSHFAPGWPRVLSADESQSTPLTYYSVSAYLPEVKSAPAPQPRNNLPLRKAQPTLAPQEIISAVQDADNSRQTLLNAAHPNVSLHEAPLPNLVAFAPVAPPAPISALAQSHPLLPSLQIKPAAPSPDTRSAHLHATLPKLTPDIVPPPPDVKASNVTLANLTPAVQPPKVELAPERVALPAETIAQKVMPPPSTAGASLASKAAGKLLALSIQPAAPAPEIKIPDASRHGLFAASPNGTAGAPGLPGSAASDAPPAGAAVITSRQGKGVNTATNDSALPAGISVTGVVPVNQPAGIIVQSTTPRVSYQPPLPRALDLSAPRMRPELSASLDRGHQPLPGAEDRAEVRSPIDDRIFGARRSYSMQMQMPSLTSASGSWVIRFAELHNTAPGELVTPEAIHKVDPAYPAELIADKVEGMVVLYAIIRADGSVSDVRVLEGFNDELNSSAMSALARWQFRPAMKNGQPVDIEAVVQIPFKVRKSDY